MSTLLEEDKRNFWLRVYFGPNLKNEIVLTVIDKAYRDFNRTLHGVADKNKNNPNAYAHLRNFLHKKICEVISQDFNQNSFDIWHKECCDKLINEYDSIINHELYYGQAQKWINMTLKYLFAIGNEKINGIDRNYKFFHIPLDNIIQEKLTCPEFNITRIPIKWSRIKDYSLYMDYQKKIREVFVGQIPMDVEFRLFNGETEIK